MAISVMSKVWERSQASGTELLLMLAIADFADADGRAYPSVQTLASKIRMSERNTHYGLRKLEASGELRIDRNAGPRGTNLYWVQILQGADFAGCRRLQLGGADACSQGVQAPAPEPSLTINEPSEGAPKFSEPIKKARMRPGKKVESTLAEYRAKCTEQGVDVIPATAPVFAYASKAGIPDEFIALAWGAFLSKYTEAQPDKRYADWRQVFYNAVRGNWLNLWRIDQGTGQYVLTTVGLQEQRAQGVTPQRKRDWE